MLRATIPFVGVIFAALVSAQDLPPGVLVLSRVKNHMKAELGRLASISCLETVQREHQSPKGKMKPLDAVRLEVLTNGQKELYASPGSRKFSELQPMGYIGSGTIANGLFETYVKDIVLNDYATDEYRGEEVVGGRRLARYDYKIPAMWSGQTIEVPGGSGRVGLHGSFWVDPESYDLVRLELNGDSFPPTLPVQEVTTAINYGRVVLGSNNFVALLPETADLRLVLESGETSHNLVEFTHCRVFGAESTINFKALDSPEQTPQFGTTTLDDTLRSLPGGLEITVKLRSRISGDMTVGTLIEGTVASDVKEKRTVVIPIGSPVRGRIRRLEKYASPFPYFIVGLEFTEVEIQGIRHLFYADLTDIEGAPGVEQILTTKNTVTTETDPNPLSLGNDLSTRQNVERLFLYNLPGVATFFYRGSKLDLAQDFRTVWKTRSLKP